MVSLLLLHLFRRTLRFCATHRRSLAGSSPPVEVNPEIANTQVLSAQLTRTTLHAHNRATCWTLESQSCVSYRMCYVSYSYVHGSQIANSCTNNRHHGHHHHHHHRTFSAEWWASSAHHHCPCISRRASAECSAKTHQLACKTTMEIAFRRRRRCLDAPRIRTDAHLVF